MKYIYKGCLPLVLCALFFLIGCKEDVISISIGETRNLIAEISTQSAVFGDKITYSVAINQTNDSLSLEEDVDVTLRFSGKNSLGEEVAASDIFENLPSSILLRKGDKKGFAEFKVKSEVANYPVTGTITAYARGYQITSAERPITISDKHYSYVTIKNNTDNTVKEGGKFILVLNVGAVAKEDVVVNINPIENGDKLIGLPSELIVKAGFKSVESDVIQVVSQEGKNDFSSVTLGFSTSSQLHPIQADKMVISVSETSVDLDPATKLYDEHWVYADPDQVFVSAANKKAVENWDATKSVLEIKEGDPHPNSDLAAKGWVFLNSYEFHPIDALTSGNAVNTYGNRVPRYMAAQNVANTQKVQSVVNEKYSTMTDEGYLRMWCAYDPGLDKTGEVTGKTNYGVSAFYASKFDGVPTGADSWESSNVRILPGTRVEVRIRVRGEKHSFNAAVWFQGNIRNVKWSTYGEVDLLENPANKNGSLNNAWQTFHWNDENLQEGADKYKPTSGGMKIDDMNEFDIYWMEWNDNNEIALGVNGQENIRIKADGTLTPSSASLQGTAWGASTHWPFKDTYNPEGMHLLLTFAGCNEWALNYYGDKPCEEVYPNWADAFKHISYEDSKTNSATPRMEIDWIRFYKTSNYHYIGNGTPAKNTPMY